MESIRSALHHLQNRPAGVPGFLLRNALSALSTSVPHGVYDLSVDDLASGRGLEAARRTAWRCLLVDGGGAVASAEQAGDARSGDASVTVGPFAEGMEKAIRVAEALPEVVAGTFELRFLRVSALHLAAVWLKSETSDVDVVIPLPPAPFGLEPLRPANAATLISILKQRATEKLTHRFHP